MQGLRQLRKMTRIEAQIKLVLLVCVFCISVEFISRLIVQAKITQRRLNSSEFQPTADIENLKQSSRDNNNNNNHRHQRQQQQQQTLMRREVHQQQVSNNLSPNFFDTSASTMGGQLTMNEEPTVTADVDLQSTSNGSAILEDLVNRFFEQHQEVVARDASGSDRSVIDSEDLQLNQTNSPVNKRAHGQANYNQQLTKIQVPSNSSVSFTQPLVATSSSANNTQSSSDPQHSIADTMEDQSYSLVQAEQEIDDRHIQYDMMIPALVDRQDNQKLYSTLKIDQEQDIRQQASGASAKLSNYELQQDLNKSCNSVDQGKLFVDPTVNSTLNSFDFAGQSVELDGRQREKLNSGETAVVLTRDETSANGSSSVIGVIGGELEQQLESSTNLGRQQPVSNSTIIESLPLISPKTDQQQSKISNATTSYRSGSIQARSMHSSVGGIKLPVLQHLRQPPYATYDQFHQRSDLQAAPISPSTASQSGRTNHQVGFQQRNGSEIGGVELTLSHLADQLSPPPPSRPLASTVANSTASVNDGRASNSTAAREHSHMTPQSTETAAIANTINLISSYLAANDSSINSNENESPQQQQQQLDNIGQPNSMDRREELEVQDNKELQNLAPVNHQPVDLNPIPANAEETLRGSISASNRTLLRDSGAPASSDTTRYYYSKENQLFSFYPAHYNRGTHNDRYYSNGGGGGSNEILLTKDLLGNELSSYSHAPSGGGADNTNGLDGDTTAPTTKLPHDFKNGAPHSGHHHEPGMHKKILESVSSQLQQHSMNAYSQSQTHDSTGGSSFLQDQRLHYQHHQSLSGLQNHNQTGGLLSVRGPTHYAASLINVTAPMVLPLSATEAMESTLAADQSSKSGLLHQSSGSHRPPSISSSGSIGSMAHSQMTRKQANGSSLLANNNSQQNLYFLPNPIGESIYSQPANQFSPPKPISADDLIASLANTGNLSSADRERMRLDGAGHLLSARRPSATASNSNGNTYASPSLATPIPSHQASDFRSPLQQQTQSYQTPGAWPSTSLPMPGNYLSGPSSSQPLVSFAASSPAPPSPHMLGYAESRDRTSSSSSPPSSNFSSSASTVSITNQPMAPTRPPITTSVSAGAYGATSTSNPTTNDFITGSITPNPTEGPPSTTIKTTTPTTNAASTTGGTTNTPTGINRRVFNLTRVEHISAECSNDFIRTVIVFNGTFKGIIYSSGYVRDPNCLYINGTGKTRYDFSIRLNQCGTLGRQEVHSPTGPNDVRRRDQVMWNTLSIQYNPIIEQEWDEHFKVSCEYGSDFWKTVSFSPFNVETNTGSPVVFTVDPPQCQMEILRGHGMVGPRQEAVSGPVTVGDPLTLLIHMKSEKGKLEWQLTCDSRRSLESLLSK